MLILILFPPPFTILILMLVIIDDIQQKEVGGNNDIHPVEVIESADPDAEWVAKEGMPSSMVRCYRTLWF